MSEKWHDILESQVLKRPDALAFSDTLGNRWSYTDTANAVADITRQLQTAGVQPGDRVLLLAENCAAVVAVLFACSRMGAAIIPFNARQSEDEVARVLAHAEPAIILFTSVVSCEARQHASGFNATTIYGAFGELDYCKLKSNPVDLEDTAAVSYTHLTLPTNREV